MKTRCDLKLLVVILGVFLNSTTSVGLADDTDFPSFSGGANDSALLSSDSFPRPAKPASSRSAKSSGARSTMKSDPKQELHRIEAAVTFASSLAKDDKTWLRLFNAAYEAASLKTHVSATKAASKTGKGREKNKSALQQSRSTASGRANGDRADDGRYSFMAPGVADHLDLRAGSDALTLDARALAEDSIFVRNTRQFLERVARSESTYWPDVIRGERDVHNYFPDIVAVGRGGNFESSGVLVARNAVLTVKHAGNVDRIKVELDLGHAVPVMLKKENNQPKIISHPTADIALLILNQNVEVARKPWIETAEMDGFLNAATGLAGSEKTLVVTGFGRTTVAPVVPASDGARRTVAVVLASRSTTLGLEPEKFAAGLVDGPGGSCHGDSGSGAYLTTPSGVTKLAGITLETINGGPCGKGAVYYRVDRLQSWLNDQLAANPAQ